MAFLFKSKKAQPGQQPGAQGLPPASRNIHTSEGSMQEKQPFVNGDRPRDMGRIVSPTPSGSINNSLNSVTTPGSPDPSRVRQRADSETQVRYKSICAHEMPNDIFANPFQGPAITVVRWHRLTHNRHECCSVPLVPATPKFYLLKLQPISSIWRRNQLNCFERRRHLHDGRSD